MKRFGSLAAVLLALQTLASGGADAKEPRSLVLASHGQSDYVIVLPSNPAPPVRTAAAELQDHLAKATGVKLPIVPEETAGADTPQIIVGPAKRLKRLLPDLDVDSLGADGIVMKTAGDDLVLVGEGQRGTLYAVYTFLEDVVGCRWWTSKESHVPKLDVLRIPALDVVHTPPLRYREAFYQDVFDGRTAARFKLNGHHHQVPEEFGDHYRFVGFVHTFFPLLPPEKYFKDHPKWYSEIGGKRTAHRSQLCLTNEEMRRELVRVVLERLRADPGAGFVSISQNDWDGHCQCEACRKVEAEEGSPAGPLIRFVNAVAADIEKEFPDVLVETLAYQYTRKPPRHVRPRRNVVVRLCSIECSFVQPLARGPQNAPFRRDIEGWARISPQLFVWNYVTNFSNYLVPHPNLGVLAPNIRYFVDHRVIGLFEQGDSQSRVGDFVALRAWLLAHLMWDPKSDEAALTRQFMEGYYGPAAPNLMEYLATIRRAAEQSGVYLRCFMKDTSPYLDLKTLNRATRLFDSAARAAKDDPVLARRVRRERLVLDHVWLRRYQALRRAAKAGNTEFLGPENPAKACEEFIRTAHEFGVGNYRENRPFRDCEKALRRQFRKSPPPSACAGLPAADWMDLQDFRFRLARPGVWAEMVDDPAASDISAVRMPGNHREWAASCPVPAELPGNRWRVFVVARAEASVADGPAMTMGIYDYKHRKGIAHLTVPMGDVADGAYHTFDLGAHPLDAGMSIWIAPPARPGKVRAVFIDRIYLVREKRMPPSGALQTPKTD